LKQQVNFETFAVDYSGQKHFKLTFIRPSDNRDKRNNIIWELECECGNKRESIPGSVINGSIKSCKDCAAQTKVAASKAQKDTDAGERIRKYPPIISSARDVWSRYKELDFDIFFKLSQLPCFYCGRAPFKIRNRLTSSNTIQKAEGNFIYNGLDRVDSSKDHSEDNVVPCCSDCNTAKMSLSLQSFAELVERIYHYWAKPFLQKLREQGKSG
jgi:hypothetical protein